MDTRTENGPTGLEGESGLRIGWGQLWIAAGFLFAVVACDAWVHRTAFSALVPREHHANQLQLYAHRVRPEPVDVLVLGSSRVLAAMDPRTLERFVWKDDAPKEVARLTQQGMGGWMLWQLVRDHIRVAPPAELLVIGLEERLFYVLSFETDEPLGLRMLGHSRDVFEIRHRDLTDKEWRALALAPLRGLQAPWLLPFLMERDVPEFVAHLHETGGAAQRPFRPLSRREFQFAQRLGQEIRAREGRREDAPFRQLEVEAFQRTLDLLETLPCRVVFVRMPVDRGYEREEAPHIRRFEREIVSQVLARGFPYHDLNRHPELREDRVFQNPTHVNREGMAIASRRLAVEVLYPLLHGAPSPYLHLLEVPVRREDLPVAPEAEVFGWDGMGEGDAEALRLRRARRAEAERAEAERRNAGATTPGD